MLIQQLINKTSYINQNSNEKPPVPLHLKTYSEFSSISPTQNCTKIFCQSVGNITTKSKFSTNNPFSHNDLSNIQQNFQKSDVFYFSNNNSPSIEALEIEEKHSQIDKIQSKTKIGQNTKEENFFIFLQEKFPNKSLNDITDVLSNIQTETMNKNPQKMEEVFENNIKLAQSRTSFASSCNLSEPVVSMPQETNGVADFLYKNLCNNSIMPVRSSINFNIPRHPLLCPCSDCQHKLVMVSDFIRHLKIDHMRLTFKYIKPGNCIELYLKAKYEHFNFNKCHSVMLVMNKIT